MQNIVYIINVVKNVIKSYINVLYNDIINDTRDQVSSKGISVAQAKPLKNSFAKNTSFLSTPQNH